MGKILLELVDVSKNFEKDFEVVKNLNLKVNSGEFVCIIGPSGCGKTVLLYLIAGFLPVTSGKILLNEKPIGSIGPDRLLLFQDHMLFPWKTVRENVLFGLQNKSVTKQEKENLASHYLGMVGLLKFKDWPIHKLSGGMRQRTAFARALMADPQMLLMDEPFSSLDSQTRKHLRSNLLDIWKKTQKTILFVTHSISEAVHLADKIYVLSGRPVTIKNTYHVDSPRPRDNADKKLLEISEAIEKDISEEFTAIENCIVPQINNKLLISNL